MRKSKIAPKIAGWFAECDHHGLQWHKPLYRELKRLVAVARAAQAAIDVEERLAGVSILADPESFTDADVRMARALSRLKRGAARKP